MIGWMAWRLHRRSLLSFGIAGFVFSFSYGFAYRQAAGDTAESQAAFGRSVSLVAKQFAFMFPLPVHPETLGGYEQYKWLSGLIIVLLLWALVAATGIARGDEERGLTTQWLVAGISRGRLLVARAVAFAIVLSTVSLASTLGISAVAPLVGQDANLAGELGKAVSIASGIFCSFAIALVVAQLPVERQTGTAFGIGLPVLLLIVNGIADTVDSASWIGVISPFHWMEMTGSAAPGGSFGWAANAGLLVAGLAFLALAAAVFERRDVGAGLVNLRLNERPPRRTAATNPMLRSSITEGLWEQRVGLSVWAIATLLLGALMVSVTRSVVDGLNADPQIAAIFQRIMPGSPYQSMLGLIWFGFALLLLAAYSVVQVSRWAAEDQEGRVQMILTAPVSRTRVVVWRAAEYMLASFVIVAAGYLGVAAAAARSDLGIEPSRLLESSAMMWPFALAFGGIGVALASRWPRLAVPFLAAFAVVEYFLGDLAPLFKLPTWVADLSVFHLVGNPVANGAQWTPALAMAAVFLAGFALAILLIQRRDVRGAE